MTRFRTLAVFLILALALAGGLQAASIVPHVHDDDFDHSSHSTCPVHQAQQNILQAIEASGPALASVDWRSTASVVVFSEFVPQTLTFQEYLRAPPVLF